MASKTIGGTIACEPIRAVVIQDCIHLIDGEVKSKKGFSGVAVKGAYGAIKKIKPGFVRGVIDALLDEWLEKLEAHYSTWNEAASGRFAEYLVGRSDDVAEDLLSVTDVRAEKTKHKSARKIYNRMRGSAKANVKHAVPKLGELIERHISSAQTAEAEVSS